MTISLAEITRVTLRMTFKPIAEEHLRALGVPLPTPWDPSDEELDRLAEAYARVCRTQEAGE